NDPSLHKVVGRRADKTEQEMNKWIAELKQVEEKLQELNKKERDWKKLRSLQSQVSQLVQEHHSLCLEEPTLQRAIEKMKSAVADGRSKIANIEPEVTEILIRTIMLEQVVPACERLAHLKEEISEVEVTLNEKMGELTKVTADLEIQCRALESYRAREREVESKRLEIEGEIEPIDQALKLLKRIPAQERELKQLRNEAEWVNSELMRTKGILEGIYKNQKDTESKLSQISASRVGRLINRKEIKNLSQRLRELKAKGQAYERLYSYRKETAAVQTKEGEGRKVVLEGRIEAMRHEATKYLKSIGIKSWSDEELKQRLEESQRSYKKIRSEHKGLQRKRAGIEAAVNDSDHREDELEKLLGDVKQKRHQLDEKIKDCEGSIIALGASTEQSSFENYKRELESMRARSGEVDVLKTLKKQVSRDEEELQRAHERAQRLESDIVSKMKEFSEVNMVATRLASDYRDITNENIDEKLDEVRFEAETIGKRRDQVKGEVDRLEAQLAAVERVCLEEARLIVTTLTLATLRKEMLEQEFDAVYVDEMSMALAPQLYLAIAGAKGQVIICGDHAQLPAIAQEPKKNPANLGLDIFTRLRIGTNAQNKPPLGRDDEDVLIFLGTQYRFPHQIEEIPNRLRLYPRKYQVDHDPIKDQEILSHVKEFKLTRGRPLMIVDTAKGAPEAGKVNNSIFCFYNALVDMAIARKLVTEDNVDPKNIGIITPYRTQAQLLSSLLKEASELKGVTASTVHKFQGDEREIIIFDVPNCKGIGAAGVRQVKKPDVAFPPDSRGRRLNVAVTRAEKAFVLVGNINFLMEHGRHREKGYRDSFYRSLIEVMRTRRPRALERGAVEIVDSEVQAECEAYHRRARYKARLKRKPAAMLIAPQEQRHMEYEGIMHFFNEITFYSALQKDLEGDVNDIVFVSPFLTVNRISWYADALRRVLANGGRVTVVTRTPAGNQHSQYHADGLQELMSLQVGGRGIEILASDHSHAKLVNINDRICYFGSLNPLSHRDKIELICRVEQGGIGKRMLEVVRIQSGQLDVLSEAEIDQEPPLLTPREALGELRLLVGRICGEKGSKPPLILSTAGIEELVEDRPSTADAVMSHSVIAGARLKIYLEDYAEEIAAILARIVESRRNKEEVGSFMRED
ncbi:hypothetical protein KAW55_04090, partial [bacterium]|nr:hypothetical protein [bacterium]